jgi:NAD-dependent deacetylase
MAPSASAPGTRSGLERVAGWLRRARRVTVLTGAGISTDSGIPDYRGPQGLWTRDPGAARMSTRADYLADPGVRRRAWRARVAHPVFGAQPNAAHRALVDLERSGRLVALLTQNIDGLHQRAGSDPRLVVELHGTIWAVECASCGRRGPMPDALHRVRAGEPDPRCRSCGGVLSSATVSFGQPLDPAVLTRAAAAARACELFLVVGSSLSVQPAASLSGHAVAAGARLVIVNAEPTPYDPLAAARVAEPIGVVLPRLAAAAGAEPASLC